MAVKYLPQAVTAKVTSVDNTAGGTEILPLRAGRYIAEIYNTDASASLFIGESGLTTSANSFEVKPGQRAYWFSQAACYGITASTTVSVDSLDYHD